MLSEVAATRYMLLNLFHATALANAEGKHLLPDSVLRIRDQAAARKLESARKLLEEFLGAGGQRRPERWRIVSRPMQFPGRARRRLLLFFRVPIGALLFLLAVSAWLALTLTPLQKIYFPAYSASSVGAQLPGNRTTLRWVMKTAPKRKAEVATPEEVVPGPDPKLPANLSPKAITEGWRGLSLSAPDKAPSDGLSKMLRQYIYDGTSLWRVFGHPSQWPRSSLCQ